MGKISKPGMAECQGNERASEILELLLSYAMPGKKTGLLARALNKRFGGLRGLLDATAEELRKVDGLDEKAASLIMLMKPLAGSYLKEKIADRDIIKDPRDVINYLRLTLSGEKIEKFLGLYLNSRNELLAVEVLHEGTLTHTLVYPRKVIELAMKHNACSVIFVHNHPGGDPSPSRADCQLMRGLEKAAATVDITVLDHMIIGRNSIFSARASGWPFEGPHAFPMAAERDGTG
jgi:DNA repair protein RadC